MPDSTYRVVFAGKPLPGHDRDAAIRNFAQLLKRTPEQVTGAFGGQPSVLKKGVSEADAEKYCRALEKAGLMVHTERDAPALDLALAAGEDAAPAPEKPALTLSLAAHDDAPMYTAPTQDKAPAAQVAAPVISSSLTLVEDEEQKAERIAAEQKKAAAAGIRTGTGDGAGTTFVCPACGHKQPSSEICSACHVVIAKFLVRKAEKDRIEAERAARMAEEEVETGADGKPSLLGKLFGKLKRE